MPFTSTDALINEKSREQAEHSFAGELLRIVLEQGRSFRASAGSDSLDADASSQRHNAAKLTDAESRIFGVRTYHNWLAGSLAGLGTFVVMFGGLRWRAAGSITAAKRLLASPTTATTQRASHKHNHFQELEGGKTRGNKFNQSEGSTATFTTSVLPDDVIAQIQFMCVGALSIVVSSVVARLAYDQQRFLRDIGEFPLQPGESRLCHAVCPAVVEHFEAKLQGEPTMNLDVASMTNDPRTVELESMMHLITNCKRRMEYEREQGGTAENPVNVPVPGVPLRYALVEKESLEKENLRKGGRSWF